MITTKLTLKETREKRGWTRKKLAARSGVAPGTIGRIEDASGHWGTNIETAILIARALGVDVYDIEWPHGLSDRGRPPLTGGIYTKPKDAEPGSNYCANCYLLLPLSGECDCT